MEETQILKMNKGDGEASYAQNSQLQRNITSVAKPMIKEAMLEILCSNNMPLIESIGIADLGCSSGPNTLSLISDIVDVIFHAKSCSLGPNLMSSSTSSSEFRVYLNDLFSNDFNTLFRSLPAFYNKLKQDKVADQFGPLFISAMPGSFYGRLFPAKSLHFVHSSSSLHWLSRVPPGLDSHAGTALNKGNIYISKSSPQSVLDAYSLQFHKDFSLFLKSRAAEIVAGARMVLSLFGMPSFDTTTTQESCYQWELLAHALMSMVSEGLIEEEKVDSFNFPYYAPSKEELKLEFQKEGSFIIDRLEAFEIDQVGGGDNEDMHHTFPMVGSGERMAKTIRAVVESMLESHFENDKMDDLFRRFAELVDNNLSKFRTKNIILVLSVTKKD